MISFTNTIDIHRPIGEVFAYLADLEHTPEWNWAISQTRKVTPGPTTIGTRYRQTRSAPKVATEDLEIIGFEPNRLIEIQGTLAQLPAHLSYRLHEAGTSTRITNRVDLKPQGALRLVGPLVAERIKGAVNDNLTRLKTLLEDS